MIRKINNWHNPFTLTDSFSTVYQNWRRFLKYSIYLCKSWNLHRKHINQLSDFHMLCLSTICNIKLSDQIRNSGILTKCKITSITAIFIRIQFRSSGHISRMSNNRLPKNKKTKKSALWPASLNQVSWSASLFERFQDVKIFLLRIRKNFLAKPTWTSGSSAFKY